ncbi:D-lyxose ketol-isomerase [Aequitasia blattaphilus]
MKRSEINNALKDMEKLVKDNGFNLPPFCNFTPQEWEEKGEEYDEVRDNMLGWDITDYGEGRFEELCRKVAYAKRRTAFSNAFSLGKE